jgi:hypothetical protein
MTTVVHLRKAALALPEVEEGTHFGMVSFSVRGRGFVSVTKDGTVQLHMGEQDAAAAEATCPSGQRLTRFDRPIGFRVPLADINGQQLNALLRAAWFHRAPKRLAATLAAADTGVTPQDSDLPKAIGRPATRALLGAGLTTLDKVATRTTDELLAIHGVGPKAARILSEALAERGSGRR